MAEEFHFGKWQKFSIRRAREYAGESRFASFGESGV
jgi:hypothetical protein